MRASLGLVPTLLVGSLLLAGCGLGAGPAPRAVSLLVTRDFGAQVLSRARPPKLSGADTVMSLLERNYPVTTRFDGGFVQSIDGLSGGSEAGSPVDWFYYVNGVQAPRGAADTNVHPGDRVWWDRHDWSQTQDVPAVIGSFPEPFLNGIEGKRLPVRVECEAAGGAACREVAAQLQRQGVPAAVSALGGGGAELLRVMVGRFSAIRADAAAASLAAGPRASGVYALFSDGGAAVTLLDENGRATELLRSGAGLIAATRYREGAPVWFVTGTSAAGVRLAARDFNAASLAHRFAIAVSAHGIVPLPVVTG